MRPCLRTPNYKAFNGAFSSGNGLVTTSSFSFDASGYADTSFRPYSSATTNNPLLLAKKVGGISGTTYYTTVIGNVQTHTPVLHNAVDATCTAAGSVQYYTCAECTTSGTTHYNKKYSDAALSTQITTTSIPALGHNFGAFTSNNDGTHSKTCSRCHDVIAEDCTMVNGTCSVCGYEESALSFDSASLVLNGYIDIVYTVDVPAGFINPYMIVEGPNGIQTINRFTQEGTKLSFTYTGITPQCMGDNIEATLTVTVDNVTCTCTKAEYSVRAYCVNKLADETISDAARKLISDTLAYGAAAQTYVSYKTNDLVNDGDDIENPTYSTFTSLSGLNASFTGTAAEDLCWTAASLTLADNVGMTFRFYAADTTGLTVTVCINGREERFSEFTSVGDDLYEITFYGIKANEFADTVSANFSTGGNTVNYSVNTYVCAKQADSNTALANLVKALYNYGVSAEAFAE